MLGRSMIKQCGWLGGGRFSNLIAMYSAAIEMGQNCDNFGIFTGYSGLSKPSSTRPDVRCKFNID